MTCAVTVAWTDWDSCDRATGEYKQGEHAAVGVDEPDVFEGPVVGVLWLVFVRKTDRDSCDRATGDSEYKQGEHAAVGVDEPGVFEGPGVVVGVLWLVFVRKAEWAVSEDAMPSVNVNEPGISTSFGSKCVGRVG